MFIGQHISQYTINLIIIYFFLYFTQQLYFAHIT